MPFFLSPFGNSQFVDTNGNPLSGGKINTYLAGTSTPATTYTTNLGTVAQANPVVLNARGLPANPIWLGNDVSYKFVLTDSADTVLMTVDNLVGINDTTESFTEWIVSGMVPTYLSATTFSVPGDQRSILQDNRRIKYALNSGTYYGYIVSTSFAAAATTVTVAPDATNLDATLSSFSYGFVSADDTSIPQQFVIAAADKVPARSSGTANALLSNAGVSGDPAIWSEFKVVQQVFTATGTYTPTAGMLYCIAEMVGGGAGGAVLAAGSAGGAGGSAGEYRRGVFTAATIGASKAVTIGAGGAAGNAGGTTSLSTLLTAVGGASSTSQTPGAGGTGGTGTGLSVNGGQGQLGSAAFSGPVLLGGQGGASFFGSGGRGGIGNLDNAAAGLAYGSGGGGNGNTSSTWGGAGAGAQGVVIVTEYVLDPV